MKTNNEMRKTEKGGNKVVVPPHIHNKDKIELPRMFRDILLTQSVTYRTEEMVNVIEKYAESFGCVTMKDEGNLYCVKGVSEIYPCIVAHTDTVHKIIPQHHYRLMQADEIVFAYDTERKDYTGIGGDDKVGIYIALCSLRDLPACKAVFFRDEESGCIGSSKAKENFFDDCGFVLQCDRRGSSDFVKSIYGELYSKEFGDTIAPTLLKYGYRETSGMTTDVDALKDVIDICMANMSCGYYNPHLKDEFINLHEVENCRRMVMELCEVLQGQRWEHERRMPSGFRYDGHEYGGHGGYGRYYGYGTDYDAGYGDDGKNKPTKKKWWEHYRNKKYDAGFYDASSWEDKAIVAGKKPSSDPEERYESMYPTNEKCHHCGEESVWYDSDTNLDYCTTCNMYL